MSQYVKTPTAGLHWIVNGEDVYLEALKSQDGELHHNLMILFKNYTGDNQNVLLLHYMHLEGRL